MGDFRRYEEEVLAAAEQVSEAAHRLAREADQLVGALRRQVEGMELHPVRGWRALDRSVTACAQVRVPLLELQARLEAWQASLPAPADLTGLWSRRRRQPRPPAAQEG